MSEKWIATAGATYDLGPTGNIGQNVYMTRVGESFLVRVGFNFDASRDNLGIALLVEPRFLPNSRLGRVGGVQLPPAGAAGARIKPRPVVGVLEHWALIRAGLKCNARA